jgi:hypothetical protein
MYKSLYILTKHINSHINKLSLKTDFKLSEITPLFEKYQSNDWENYKTNNPIKLLASPQNFKRIPVVFPSLESHNCGLYDIYLVEWEPFCNTGLQNHPDSSCLIKVLEGKINKQVFHYNGVLLQDKPLNKNEIELIHTEKELYRIANETKSKAYSLHLYSPPIVDLEIEFQEELKNRDKQFFTQTPHLAKDLLNNIYNKNKLD